jgi:hypothetical protein
MSFVGKAPAYGSTATQKALAEAHAKCTDAERRLTEAHAHRARVKAEYEALLRQVIPEDQ